MGKETVQNLLAIRFGNTLFEPLWDSAHIDNVQITVSETVGVEGRWGYYDKAGAMRDMVQKPPVGSCYVWLPWNHQRVMMLTQFVMRKSKC